MQERPGSQAPRPFERIDSRAPNNYLFRVVADSVYKIPYDGSVRMLTQQTSALDNLRSRASTILAAASLVTTFLGAQAFAKPTLTKDAGDRFVLVAQRLDLAGWIAIGALVGVLVCTLVVLYPWAGWEYGQSARQMIEATESFSPPLSFEEAQRSTAKNLEQNFRDNESKLSRLSWFFKAACILTVVETALWIVDLETIS